MSEDEKVRDALRTLREHDASTAPPFARVLANAERAARMRRRRAPILALSGASVAMAAAILVVLWLRGPAPTPRSNPEPLAFLLAPPSASIASSESIRDLEESF